MTQKGWTHITIPEDFVDELRETATREGLPIWRYIKNSMNDDNISTLCGGNQARPKVIDSRSILAGVQGFESLPPHFILGL
jgi:hypothetical protein